jgi:hypothetical protein
MSGGVTIPGPNYTLLVGGDGTTPIYSDSETTTTSTIYTPDTLATNSTNTTDLTVEPLSVTSNSGIDLTVEPLSVTSDSKSEIDLKPVAVDSCTTIKLAPLPPSRIEQPYSQHFGFTFMGVELFGFNTSGRYETLLNSSPPAAHGKWHEHHERRDRLAPPTVVGRPRGITVRVIDD